MAREGSCGLGWGAKVFNMCVKFFLNKVKFFFWNFIGRIEDFFEVVV